MPTLATASKTRDTADTWAAQNARRPLADQDGSAVHGIAWAVVFSLPIWALLGFALLQNF